MKENVSRWLAFFLTASLAAACSSSDSKTDETSVEGAGGAGGGLEDDAGTGDDASTDAEAPGDAGPDAHEGGAGGAGGGSQVTCGEGTPLCSESEEGFDPDAPGHLANFDLGLTLMMGQRFGYVAAFFEQAAREDWCKEAASTIPLGTCVIVDPKAAPAPACSTNADCAPEQECMQRVNNGSAVPCSEHCATPRMPIDIGPVEVTGFTSGPMTLTADPSQSNGYIPPGDGTLAASEFAFDTTYVFEGEGDSEQGIGAFQGQIKLGPELVITSPELVASGGFGLPAIEIDTEQPLTLEWSGSVDGAEIMLELSASDWGGPRGHVKCRLNDSGGVVLTQDILKDVNLGDEPFLNNLNIERIVKGTVSGEGITRGEVTSRQVLLVNMAKK